MANKRPVLRYVKFVRSRDGRGWYGYFDTGNKTNGKRVYSPMGLYDSPGFFDRYATLQGHRSRKQAVEGALTVTGMIRAYERSQAYSRLAENTKRNYGYSFAKIREQFGDFPVDALTRRHITIALQERITGNGSRNMFVKVLGALYRWARKEELTDAKPTEGVELYDIGEHEPWADDLLREGLQEGGHIRLAVTLLYFTGQRIGDVVRLRWGDVQAGAIVLTPQKTKKTLKELVIPIHRDLARELTQTPKRGLTILADEAGRPLKVADLRYALQQWALARGHKVVPHGLRKNAVNALLQAECTIAEVASITGQSFAMVEYYAKRVNQKTLAEAAIIKLERKANVQADGNRG